MIQGFRFFTLLAIILLFSTKGISQDQIASLPNGKKVVLYDDHTWAYYEGFDYDFGFSKLSDNQIPSFLRQGINVQRATLVTAVEMYLQGWRYTMPRPKSTQASWGNSDGRTTWWYGYWYNNQTGRYSNTTPQKKQGGYYKGDSQNQKGMWRNGGSPRYPSKVDWLLSDGGGVRP
jgi:hypothetical protein